MWRKLIYLYLIYVVIEGALRKWVLPEYSNALFVLKDLILAAAFLMLVISEDFKNKNFLTPNETTIWRSWVILFCALAVISGISISTAAGLRYYVAALPLAIVLPHLLTGWNDIRLVIRISLYVSMAICMLGVIQYSNPLDSEFNRYAWATTAGDVSSFGVADDDRQLGIEIDRPRITGTFSYISTYAVYLQFMFLVAWAAVVTSRSHRERILALICLLLLFVNIAMTGTRGALLISVILSIPFMALLAKQGPGLIFQIGIAAAVATTAVGGLYAFSDPFNLVLLRDEGTGDAEERILGTLLSPINTLGAAKFLGNGIGSTFAGLEEIGVATSVDSGFDEVNMDRIGLESGILGYLFMVTVKLLYLIKTWTLVVQARSREIGIWGLVSLGYQLSFIWSIPLYNAVASAFYFSSVGLYYWLRNQNSRLPSPGIDRIDDPLVLQNAYTGR